MGIMMSFRAYLQERILLLTLEFVGAEQFQTTSGFLPSETLLRALEKLEDVINDDGLQVDLLLIVQVLGRELNLRKTRV